jgi:hypothetical protein
VEGAVKEGAHLGNETRFVILSIFIDNQLHRSLLMPQMPGKSSLTL